VVSEKPGFFFTVPAKNPRTEVQSVPRPEIRSHVLCKPGRNNNRRAFLATRFDKLARSFFSALCFVAIVANWL
jgi:hypothetical protein